MTGLEGKLQELLNKLMESKKEGLTIDCKTIYDPQKDSLRCDL